MVQPSASASLSPRQTLWAWFYRLAWLWEHPLASGLLALAGYTLLALLDGAFWRGSCCPYYTWLAQSFLAGRLDVVNPPATHDLSLFEGRYYLYWGPLPALLLVPLVGLVGDRLNDVHVTLGMGAMNVGLVALVLRQATLSGVIDLSPGRRGLLVLGFTLGTVHMTLAPYGGVWFTGQLVGFACVALAYLAALRLRGGWAFGLTGLALAGALLSRNHLVLTGLWPAVYLWVTHSGTWQRRLTLALYSGLPIALAVAGLAAYNWLRFGNPLDNGLAYHSMATEFRQSYQQYGVFHPYYLPTNIYYQYIFYPLPIRPESFQGGGLFWLSPFLLAALWGVYGGRPRWSSLALLATILLTATPIVLLMGTGWVQFGPRYTLDFTLPLLLLTALGIRRWPPPLIIGLTVMAIIQYSVGAVSLGPQLR